MIDTMKELIEVKVIRDIEGKIYPETIKAEIIEIEGRTCFQYFEDGFYEVNDFETGCQISSSILSEYQAYENSAILLEDKNNTLHHIKKVKKILNENGIAFPVNSYDIIHKSKH